VLSGGSNVLFRKNIKKPVIHINLKGIEISEINESQNHVLVKVQAGENWHEFVLWCLKNNFGGTENLSLIPGKAGTSPMQNIGAYGVEIKDIFHQLEALEISSNTIRSFDKQSCNFGYRESIFKNVQKNKYIITSVTFRLTRKNHKLNTSYGAIQQELKNNSIYKPSITDISNAVIAIRKSKLPDPKEIGNSGSFFKNPVISKGQFTRLKRDYPEIPNYVISTDFVKIPAGWLIEQCGFKGNRFGNAGVHDKQALVLVNHGNATGQEIYELSLKILKAVLDKFDIDLDIEVNII
jgi:UDP-N-acetylmuramate dehydrogenase